MDNAVGLVQAYLRLNGYFTVAEYPVALSLGGGSHRMLTDLDVLAFRFPRPAERNDRRGHTVDTEVGALDPALRCPPDRADMIVGEVKEGRGRLNAPAREPAVLREALVRFGCCHRDEASTLVSELIRAGRASSAAGHDIRMLVFGSHSAAGGDEGYTFVSLGQVVDYLRAFLRRHWDVLRHVQTKDPVLGFLQTLEKAGREEGSRS